MLAGAGLRHTAQDFLQDTVRAYVPVLAGQGSRPRQHIKLVSANACSTSDICSSSPALCIMLKRGALRWAGSALSQKSLTTAECPPALIELLPGLLSANALQPPACPHRVCPRTPPQRVSWQGLQGQSSRRHSIACLTRRAACKRRAGRNPELPPRRRPALPLSVSSARQ